MWQHSTGVKNSLTVFVTSYCIIHYSETYWVKTANIYYLIVSWQESRSRLAQWFWLRVSYWGCTQCQPGLQSPQDSNRRGFAPDPTPCLLAGLRRSTSKLSHVVVRRSWLSATWAAPWRGRWFPPEWSNPRTARKRERMPEMEAIVFL